MNKINKKEALQKLSELEIQTKELRKIIDTPENIIDIIKTFSDACEYLGIEDTLPFPTAKTNRQISTNAFYKLDIITEAILEGKKLDWENSSQYKWYPWFNNYCSGSGFRFYVSFCEWSFTSAFGGARLYLDTKEKSDYVAKQFISIYNEFLNPTK